MLGSALASILRSGRADFNTRFAAARHVHPDLDAGAFSEFLETAVDALVRSVDRSDRTVPKWRWRFTTRFPRWSARSWPGSAATAG
jgi:hypothetical protein